MAEVRPYSVTRYKYCWADGVKRVGSEHPNHPPCESADVENDDLHCIHAQNIWFVVSWSLGGGGGSGVLWTKSKTTPRGNSFASLCLLSENPSQLSGRSKWVQEGENKKASEEFGNMGTTVNLQDMTALSAGFFGCVCSQSPSGNLSETSLRRTAWKQNKDSCCRKPSLQKNLPLLVIILQKHFNSNCSIE